MPPAPAPLALVALDGLAVLAGDGDAQVVHGGPDALAAAVAAREADGPRWVLWSARGAAPLVGAGLHLARAHDLAAVHRLLHGGGREDPATVHAAAHGLPEPPEPSRRPRPAHGTGLLELDLDGGGGGDGPVGPDGALTAAWTSGRALAADEPAAVRAERALRWAQLALEVAARQRAALDGHALSTAWSESAAALLAVELEVTGLPVDVRAAEELLGALVGPRPRSEAEERAARAARDAPVLAALGVEPGAVDLRSPAAVLAALRARGVDLPDTRSWRLERLTADPATGRLARALLHHRRAERVATTYGYAWLDAHVGADGRLRGRWSAADAAAGRMTAQAGLHNLPAELRPVVAAEPGHVLVRADLGQVEPRVLAAVSGDEGLLRATADEDLYAPVAAALGVDRPTAKVAVLAAMYGQTSGAAGRALERMERAYPRALAHLRAAEAAGREGRSVRTHGGRLVRTGGAPAASAEAVAARGRFARNAVVQGSAAELFKAWAVTVRAGLAGTGGRVVLCLHDELLLHVPEADAARAVALLERALTAAAGWWAPGSGARFVAEASVVRRWSEV
ncbi:DNA polymerase [Kineococcus terrestris]|uniref:DNA polymerase n=1 Tax=Kineococcus terrestris TaxID=2044856 RepID=UPI0034DB082E